MDKSEQLQSIIFSRLTHHELWNSRNNVKNEVSTQIILENLSDIREWSGLFNEVEQDLDEQDDVDWELCFVELVFPMVLGVNFETAGIGARKS